MRAIHNRQGPEEASILTELTVYNFPNYYQELQRYGIHFGITLNLIRDVITYVLKNKEEYSGTVEEKSKQILVDLEKDLSEIFYVANLYKVPYTRVNTILEDLIRFTLENSSS